MNQTKYRRLITLIGLLIVLALTLQAPSAPDTEPRSGAFTSGGWTSWSENDWAGAAAGAASAETRDRATIRFMARSSFDVRGLIRTP